jgi:hypothetical protein
MEIKLNTSSVGGTGANRPVAKQRPTAAAGELVPFPATAALERDLRNTPEVRPEKVAAAKKLVASADYPPAETLDRVADLMAKHLKP